MLEAWTPLYRNHPNITALFFHNYFSIRHGEREKKGTIYKYFNGTFIALKSDDLEGGGDSMRHACPTKFKAVSRQPIQDFSFTIYCKYTHVYRICTYREKDRLIGRFLLGG